MLSKVLAIKYNSHGHIYYERSYITNVSIKSLLNLDEHQQIGNLGRPGLTGQISISESQKGFVGPQGLTSKNRR